MTDEGTDPGDEGKPVAGDRPLPSAGKAQSVWIAVAGAVGLALLGFGGQVLYDLYKDWRNPPSAQRAEQLQEKFNSLGDLPRRAGVYVDSGNEGSAADVRELSRHFHIIVDAFASNKVTAQELQRKYGGYLRDWSIRYRRLAVSNAGEFTAADRVDFRKLSDALDQVSGSPPSAEEMSRLDPVNDAGLTGNVSDYNFFGPAESE